MDFDKRFRVPKHGFRLADRDPADHAGLSRAQARVRRAADVERLAKLQDRLYAEGKRVLLVVLKGLDASGKDGTIKHVMSGVNPEGVSVTAFKRPTALELAREWYVIPADHKWFLRTAVAAINVQHLSDLDPQYPAPSGEQRREMQEAVALLRAEA